MTVLISDCPDLKLIARGKVRDMYEVDDKTMLFVTTDRISAFDFIIEKNVIPGKGKILTQMSLFWFDFLSDVLPNHVITADFDKMPERVQKYRDQFEGRSILVKKMHVFRFEVIVRGYIAGSAWAEYKQKGTVCGIEMPKRLVECEKLSSPLFTPSIKVDYGGHDKNVHPSTMVELIGSQELVDKIKDAAVTMYIKASEYAETRGIIIADTKFEFGLDENGNLALADEVLTPDCSRFWSASKYETGHMQEGSYDKQYVLKYCASIGFDKGMSVDLPADVVSDTVAGYNAAYNILTGKEISL